MAGGSRQRRVKPLPNLSTGQCVAEQVMKAGYLHGRYDLRVSEEPIPKLTVRGEALVRIGAA